MTILYILISTDPFAGSTKSFMILLKGVMQTGVKVIVVVPDTKGIYTMLKQMGAEVVVQNFKPCTWTDAKTIKHTLLYVPRQLGRLVVNFFTCCNLIRKLEGKDIDIVHSNSTITPLGRYIAKKRRLPHIYHIREYGDKDFGLKYFPSNASFHHHLKEKGTYSVCITKDIQRYHGLAEWSSSRVIYNGIIQEGVKGPHTNARRDFFIYAGRIEPTKGLLKLINAYCSYAKNVSSPLPLKVAGEVIDPSYMNAIKDCISTNNIKEKVFFLGKVTNMSELYQGAKAIIIPSEHEGFGRCMPEAMSYGCIAIGHDTAGTKEQFDNGLEMLGTEIGLRYKTQEELTSSLLRIHDMSEDEMRSMQDAAYQCVSHLYTDNAYINAVLDFYKYVKEDKSHYNI